MGLRRRRRAKRAQFEAALRQHCAPIKEEHPDGSLTLRRYDGQFYAYWGPR